MYCRDDYTADIIYTESAERQLPTEQTRTNCETTESTSHGKQDVIATIIVITSM